MNKMELYQSLDRFFPTSYRLKLFSVGFVGTHIPLLAVLFYTLGLQGHFLAHIGEILIIFCATLIGASITLTGIWLILTPIETATIALQLYAETREIMKLKTTFRDDAGQLLFHVQKLLIYVEGLLNESEQLAFSDGLTGLMNRRCFDLIINSEFEPGKNNHKLVHVAIVDVDNFKQINDEFGHQKGDEVLKAFTEVLRRCMKNRYLVARIGGEEFAIVFMDTPVAEVDAYCQHIRLIMEARKTLPRPVTVSIGVAARRGDEQMIDTIARADKALYEAKRRGRNRVEFEKAAVLHETG